MRAALPFIVTLLFLLPADAAAGSNEAAGAFAIRGGSARGAVIGEAYAAIGGDADALLWNPAALASVGETHFQATYHDVYGLGLARHSSISVAVRRIDEDVAVDGDSLRIVRSGAPTPVFAASMSVLIVDVGDESYWEFVPTVGAATHVTGGTSIGAAARYLRASSTIDGVRATGYAFDAGITQRLPLDATLGIAFRNLLGREKWKEGREETEPRELIVAAAVPARDRLVLLGGLATDVDDDLSDRWNAALEVHAVPEVWTLRGGIESRRDGDDMRTRWLAGTRLRVGAVALDYGFVEAGETPGDTHRVSVLVAP